MGAMTGAGWCLAGKSPAPSRKQACRRGLSPGCAAVITKRSVAGKSHAVAVLSAMNAVASRMAARARPNIRNVRWKVFHL
jgi:hypothetical protein